MYTDRNFKSKKELKAAVAAYIEYAKNPEMWLLTYRPLNTIGDVAKLNVPVPQPVTYHQPGPFGGNEPQNGVLAFEGPHYPQPHKWYAECTVENGVIVKVK